MYSIKSVYKIGHGPSSSHTMGPANAAKFFGKRYPNATNYVVTLYGSLALTGKGHLTDKAIISTLAPKKVKIIWNHKDTTIEHPNTMDFVAYNGMTTIGSMRIYSIGGGSITFQGGASEQHEVDVYPIKTATEILGVCKIKKWSLEEYIKKHEGKVLYKHLKKVWNVMTHCIKIGLTTSGLLPGRLNIRRHAKEIYNSKTINHNKTLLAYAFAVSEVNASGGIVVTTPTCGACGVLPAVLLFAQKELKASKEKILDALAIAGLVGNITRTNGSIAGAEAGCQAEIGTACAMAAAAYSYLIGLSNEDIFCAASSALEHHLGLTCDPVLGYVQSPCIERNALCAPRAIDAANLISLKNTRIHIFNYDDIVLTMLETGKALNPGYRETSLAGLSSTYKNKRKISKKDFHIKVS